jgi:hypothetical protein
MAVVIPKITFSLRVHQHQAGGCRGRRTVEVLGSNLAHFTGTSEISHGILQHAEENTFK